MRKSYIYLLFVLVLSGGLFFNLISDEEGRGYQKVKSNSSESLIQQQIRAKSERRQKGYAKPDKPDKYLEYIHLLKTGWNPNNNYPINNALNELKSARLKSASLKSANILNWKERGPGNVGGRTRGLVIDPDDASGATWFTGPVGGGVWKTTDAGLSWTSLTLDWPNLSVSTLVMANSNHDVIYAGTGEGFGNQDAIKGNGIFKTTNRGVTWVQLSSTASNANFAYVNRLIVDPSNENIVVAATNTGIFRTTDGGDTWTLQYASNSKVQDLRTKTDDFSTQFATVNNGVRNASVEGIISSVDGGLNWNLIKPLSVGRIELGVSESNPDYLYAMTAQSDIYLSVDGGDNWEKTTAVSKEDFTSGQGWYNNTLVADPFNENKLFVGGVDLYEVIIGKEVESAGNEVYDISTTGAAFFSWKDIGGQYCGRGIKVYTDNSDLLRDVDINFGGGNSQKAHRFSSNSSAATPESGEMQFQDYVSVPFTATDKATGENLMISFRDDNHSGQFEIGDGYEQIFIHSLAYDESAASPLITAVNGISHNQIVLLNPVIAPGHVWNSLDVPEASIELNNYLLKSRSITSEQRSDWRYPSQTFYSHADHHHLKIIEGIGNPYRIINCNDGGVFISDDGGTSWEERTSGYVTTQFYGISKHPQKDIYLGGTQDNGTWLSKENPSKLSEWTYALGGDGFETVWNAADANKMAMSLYYNQIRLSYDGGQSWVEANIDDIKSGKAPFVTRIANEASNPDLLLVGGESGIWRSQDFGKDWSLTTMPAGTWNYPTSNPHIAVSPVNSKYVWAGTALSGNDALAFSSDGGKTFSALPNVPGTYAYISDLVPHPTNDQGIYVLFAQSEHPKILYSHNGGLNWSDLSAFVDGESTNGFPDVAVYSLVVMPYDTNVLWAGTEIGIFESLDGGTSWHYASNGLPAVCIWDMKIVGQQLVVGTHGLGVWTLDLPQVTVDRAPLIKKVGKAPNGSFNFEVDYYKDYASVEFYINDELQKTFNDVTVGSTVFNIEYLSEADELSCYLIAQGTSDDKQYSNYMWVANPQYEAPVSKYANRFTTRQDDFFGSGFKVSNELFGDWAIHSPHPYSENRELTYTLAYPIIVLDDREEALVSYRDLALVEPGNTGARFGDETFWDYVIVEGTLDGINWLPLSDIDGDGNSEGYDVNASDKWQAFSDRDKNKTGIDYENISAIPTSSELMEEHVFNLQNTFAAGDTVMLRFRLFSDAMETGYGWVIDDLVIQESGTSAKADNAVQGNLTIGPNPVTSHATISLVSQERGELTIQVFSIDGKVEMIKSFHKDTDSWSDQLQVAGLRKGIKLVVVDVGNQRYKQKILIQ
ncbi:T9SS type A sorting domain-containing protein [Carboxylicivirga taeanensis]|uniref:T9SS type A sorting domain-containing protein n=1 Tax=Carboxylicivirga taeanensis TaxID=1416875 RepID=UPI003F6DE100